MCMDAPALLSPGQEPQRKSQEEHVLVETLRPSRHLAGSILRNWVILLKFTIYFYLVKSLTSVKIQPRVRLATGPPHARVVLCPVEQLPRAGFLTHLSQEGLLPLTWSRSPSRSSLG